QPLPVTQAPVLKILKATRKNGRTTIQAAATGSTAAITRYQVKLDSRVVAALVPRGSPFSVKLRRSAKRAALAAVDSSGKVLASASARVTTLRKGKRDVGKGRRIGS